MKVILIDENPRLGQRAGDVVNVKDGYAPQFPDPEKTRPARRPLATSNPSSRSVRSGTSSHRRKKRVAQKSCRPCEGDQGDNPESASAKNGHLFGSVTRQRDRRCTRGERCRSGQAPHRARSPHQDPRHSRRRSAPAPRRQPRRSRSRSCELGTSRPLKKRRKAPQGRSGRAQGRSGRSSRSAAVGFSSFINRGRSPFRGLRLFHFGFWIADFGLDAFLRPPLWPLWPLCLLWCTCLPRDTSPQRHRDTEGGRRESKSEIQNRIAAI